MCVDRLYASNGGVTQTNNIMQSSADLLRARSPLRANCLYVIYRCFFGDLLRIYCGPIAPHRPTVYMRFPQNPTGPQCISRIDLRARRRSAVDPQTNTCETVVPQDLTGRQWIRKIQRACSKSAKSIYGRARSRSSVDPQTNTCKTVDPQDPTGPQSIRKIQRACCTGP